MMIQTRRRAKSPRWRLETAAAERLLEEKLLPTTSSLKGYFTVSRLVLIHDKIPKSLACHRTTKNIVSHLFMLPNKKRRGRDLMCQNVKRKSAVNSVRNPRVTTAEGHFQAVNTKTESQTYVATCTSPFGFVFTILAQQFWLESSGWGLGRQQEQCMLVFVGFSCVWP